MKVILLVTHMSPLLGMERSALRLEEQLRKHYQVEIVVVGGSEAQMPDLANLTVLGAEVSGIRRLLALPRIHRFAQRLNQQDVVILVGVWTAIPWLLRLRRGARTVVWEHTLLREKLSFSKKLRLLDGMARHLYKRADAVVAVSEPVAEDLRNYRQIAPVSVIPNYIAPEDQDNHDRVEPKSGRRILCVGSLSKIKAHDLAVEALALLPEEYTLRLIGAGPREIPLRDRARKLNVEKRVEFCGFLQPERVRREMNEAFVLLHTSVAETFGLVLVEAARQRLPVISIDTRTSTWLIPKYVPGWTTRATPDGIARMILQATSLSDEEHTAAKIRRQTDFASAKITKAWCEVLESSSKPEARS